MARPDFPDDENGDVLRRMHASGDDLSKPRTIDFQHVFPAKAGAEAFLHELRSKGYKAEVRYFEAKERWDVQVDRHMLPTHAGITKMEMYFDNMARTHGGKADGWGCLQVDS